MAASNLNAATAAHFANAERMTRRIARTLERILFVAGFATFAYVGVSLMYAKAYQAYLSWNFTAELPVSLSKARTAIPLTEGMPVGKLEIPRLGLSVMVLEGVESSTLKLGPGHVPQTALPGRTGNVGIAAHRDTYFRALRDIQVNDVIRIRTMEGVFDYAVEWTGVVKPTAVEVLNPTEEPSLTLVTCYPFYYVGSAPDRFIVRARLISRT